MGSRSLIFVSAMMMKMLKIFRLFNREEIYRWMGGQKTPLKTDAADDVDISALVDGLRNDDVAAEQLRIGSGCVLIDLCCAFFGGI